MLLFKFGKQLFENYKRIMELIEMNRLSGRLPVASARRLSASISSSQRPHSSYSLNVNATSTQNIDESSQRLSQTQHTGSSAMHYFDHTVTPPMPTLSSLPQTTPTPPQPLAKVPATSLLIRKPESYHESSPPANVDLSVYRSQQASQSNTIQLGYNNEDIMNGGECNVDEAMMNIVTCFNSSVMTPISVSTQPVNKSLGLFNSELQHNRILSQQAGFDLIREKSIKK